jgi:hypothetical protein
MRFNPCVTENTPRTIRGLLWQRAVTPCQGLRAFPSPGPRGCSWVHLNLLRYIAR